jgi:hypothetical protein
MLAAGIGALALAWVASGCAHVTHAGSDGTLRIALTEYRVSPRAASTPPGRLKIIVRNFGRLSHNLVVSRHGKTAGSTQPIAPGASATLHLTLSPGTYTMASKLLSDQALGQYGTLSVGS